MLVKMDLGIGMNLRTLLAMVAKAEIRATAVLCLAGAGCWTNTIKCWAGSLALAFVGASASAVPDI